MPLPTNYGTGIVTGTFTDTNGDPVVGTISFTPSASRLLGTGAVILGDAVVVDLDADGSLSVTLPASNDPNVLPTDFTYRVDETFVGTVGSTYFIEVLEGTTLDLSDVAVPGVVNNGTVIWAGQLPSQTGNAGKLLRTNGTTTSWAGLGSVIAAATEKDTPVGADEFVLSDSAASGVEKRVSFTDLAAAIGSGAIPTPVGQLGKFLSSDNTDALWVQGQSDAVPQAPGTASAGTDFAMARGDHVHATEVADAIVDGVVDVAPSQNAVFDALATKATKVSITGATKTKVTYNADGIVTGGADATTADIADSTNKRYVTDAQRTVIGNTSGTNTGDQTLPTLSSLGAVPTSRTLAGLDLSADRTAAALRTALGLVIGTDVAAQSSLTAKADLASPTFTGTPAAPTATAGTNTTQIATTAFVASARAATNTIPHNPLVDDLRLGPPGLTMTPSAAGAVLSSTTSWAVTYLMPCPIWVPEDCQIDALEVWQNIAATDSGATIELGLGPVSQWPFTGTLLLSAGTTSATAAAGLRTIGFTPTSVKAGLHWGYLKFISSTTAGTSPQFVKFNANPTPLNPYVGTAPAASYPAYGTPYGSALTGTDGIPSNLSTPTLSLSNQGYVWMTARVYV